MEVGGNPDPYLTLRPPPPTISYTHKINNTLFHHLLCGRRYASIVLLNLQAIFKGNKLLKLPHNMFLNCWYWKGESEAIKITLLKFIGWLIEDSPQNTPQIN